MVGQIPQSFKVQWINTTLKYLKDDTQLIMEYPEMPVNHMEYLHNLIWQRKLEVGLGFKSMYAPVWETMRIYSSKYQYKVFVNKSANGEKGYLVIEKIPKKEQENPEPAMQENSGQANKTPDSQSSDSESQSSQSQPESPIHYPVQTRPKKTKTKTTTTKKKTKSEKFLIDKHKTIESISPVLLKKTLQHILEFLLKKEEASIIFSDLAPVEANFLENFLGIYNKRMSFRDILSPACNKLLDKMCEFFQEFDKVCKLEVYAAKYNVHTKKREVTFMKVPRYTRTNVNESQKKILTPQVKTENIPNIAPFRKENIANPILSQTLINSISNITIPKKNTTKDDAIENREMTSSKNARNGEGTSVNARNGEGTSSVKARNGEATSAINARNGEGTSSINARNGEGTSSINARNGEGASSINARNGEGTSPINARNGEGTSSMSNENLKDQLSTNPDTEDKKLTKSLLITDKLVVLNKDLSKHEIDEIALPKNAAKTIPAVKKIDKPAINKIRARSVGPTGRSVGPTDRSVGPTDRSLGPRKDKLLIAMSTPLESDKAMRMMRLMGWQGGALGLRGDGIVEPIIPALDLVPRKGLGHVKQKPKSTKSVKPVKKSKVEEKPKPAKTSQTEQRLKPVKTSQNEEEPKPVKTSQNEEEPKPVKTSQNEEKPKPDKTSQNEEEPKPAKTSQNEEKPKPVKTSQNEEKPKPVKPSQNEEKPKLVKTSQNEEKPKPVKTSQIEERLKCAKNSQTEQRLKPVKTQTEEKPPRPVKNLQIKEEPPKPVKLSHRVLDRMDFLYKILDLISTDRAKRERAVTYTVHLSKKQKTCFDNIIHVLNLRQPTGISLTPHENTILREIWSVIDTEPYLTLDIKVSVDWRELTITKSIDFKADRMRWQSLLRETQDPNISIEKNMSKSEFEIYICSTVLDFLKSEYTEKLVDFDATLTEKCCDVVETICSCVNNKLAIPYKPVKDLSEKILEVNNTWFLDVQYCGRPTRSILLRKLNHRKPVINTEVIKNIIKRYIDTSGPDTDNVNNHRNPETINTNNNKESNKENSEVDISKATASNINQPDKILERLNTIDDISKPTSTDSHPFINAMNNFAVDDEEIKGNLQKRNVTNEYNDNLKLNNYAVISSKDLMGKASESIKRFPLYVKDRNVSDNTDFRRIDMDLIQVTINLLTYNNKHAEDVKKESHQNDIVTNDYKYNDFNINDNSKYTESSKLNNKLDIACEVIDNMRKWYDHSEKFLICDNLENKDSNNNKNQATNLELNKDIGEKVIHVDLNINTITDNAKNCFETDTKVAENKDLKVNDEIESEILNQDVKTQSKKEVERNNSQGLKLVSEYEGCNVMKESTDDIDSEELHQTGKKCSELDIFETHSEELSDYESEESLDTDDVLQVVKQNKDCLSDYETEISSESTHTDEENFKLDIIQLESNHKENHLTFTSKNGPEVSHHDEEHSKQEKNETKENNIKDFKLTNEFETDEAKKSRKEGEIQSKLEISKIKTDCYEKLSRKRKYETTELDEFYEAVEVKHKFYITSVNDDSTEYLRLTSNHRTVDLEESNKTEEIDPKFDIIYAKKINKENSTLKSEFEIKSLEESHKKDETNSKSDAFLAGTYKENTTLKIEFAELPEEADKIREIGSKLDTIEVRADYEENVTLKSELEVELPEESHKIDDIDSKLGSIEVGADCKENLTLESEFEIEVLESHKIDETNSKLDIDNDSKNANKNQIKDLKIYKTCHDIVLIESNILKIEVIQKKIQNKIENTDSETEFLPLLKYHGILNKGIVYSCHNKETCLWLRNTLSDYSVIDYKSAINNHKLKIKVTSCNKNAKKLLELLEVYNQGIKSQNWKIISEKHYNNNSLILFVEMNSNSFEYVCDNNFSLFVGYDVAQFTIGC